MVRRLALGRYWSMWCLQTNLVSIVWHGVACWVIECAVVELKMLHPDSAAPLTMIKASTHWTVEELREALCAETGLMPDKCVFCHGVMGERVNDSGIVYTEES